MNEKDYIVINIKVIEPYTAKRRVSSKSTKFWKKRNKDDEWFQKFKKEFVKRIKEYAEGNE